MTEELEDFALAMPHLFRTPGSRRRRLGQHGEDLPKIAAGGPGLFFASREATRGYFATYRPEELFLDFPSEAVFPAGSYTLETYAFAFEEDPRPGFRRSTIRSGSR